MRDRELLLVVVAIGPWCLCALGVVPYRGHLVPNPVRSAMSFAHELDLFFRDAGDVHGFGQDTSSRAPSPLRGRSAATGQNVGPPPDYYPDLPARRDDGP